MSTTLKISILLYEQSKVCTAVGKTVAAPYPDPDYYTVCLIILYISQTSTSMNDIVWWVNVVGETCRELNLESSESS